MKKTLLFIAASCMIGSISAQNINVNGSFETWRSITVGSGSLEAPNGWFGIDSLIYGASGFPGVTPQRMLFKEMTTANVHTGAASAKIMSRNQGQQIGVLPGVLANARPAITGMSLTSFTYVGGTPVTQRVGSVHAWIKYAPKGTDKGRISAQAVLAGQGSGGRDSVIGTADTILSQAITTYTRVGVNMKYTANATPDKLLIIFLSSSGSGTDSSTMWVDEVVASPFPVGVNEQVSSNGISVYPNPASDNIYVANMAGNAVTIRIYSLDGRMVASKAFTTHCNLSLSQFSSGTYHYTIANSNGVVIKKDKFVVSK